MDGWWEHSLYGLQSEPELKKVFAKHVGVDPSNVIITQGSSETLSIAALAYGLHGGEVVTPWPTYEGLPRYADTIDATVHRVPLDEYLGHDFEAMDRRITPVHRTSVGFGYHLVRATGTPRTGTPRTGRCRRSPPRRRRSQRGGGRGGGCSASAPPAAFFVRS